MKFSENWLRQHVTTDATRDELAATLTAIGLEVEEIDRARRRRSTAWSSRRSSSARSIPKPTRLQVCQVDTGTGDRADRLRRAERARRA